MKKEVRRSPCHGLKEKIVIMMSINSNKDIIKEKFDEEKVLGFILKK